MKNLLKKLLIPALMVLALVCAAPTASAADLPFAYEVGNDGVIIVALNAGYEGDVVIPDKIDGVPVTVISDGAFSFAEGLTSVKLPSSLKTIGNSAFEGCLAIESISIPDSVTSIGTNAFASCAELKDVTIGKGIDKISNGMFEGCSSLVDVVLPENIKTIGDYAFSCCDSIETIVLYPNITSIGSYAFYDCDSFKKIALPETVTAIAEGTFAECELLESVSLQKTVTKIDALAFDGCGKMNVYYTGTMGAWAHIAIEGEGNDALTEAVLSVGHKHDDKQVVLVKPNCTEKGLGNYSCECGYVYNAEIAAVGHKKVNIPEIPASCTKAGSTAGEECSVCHVILTQPQTIPAPGHAEVQIFPQWIMTYFNQIV